MDRMKHDWKLLSGRGEIREWMCRKCGRVMAEGYNQQHIVLQEGDESAHSDEEVSGLSHLWLEALRALDI